KHESNEYQKGPLTNVRGTETDVSILYGSHLPEGLYLTNSWNGRPICLRSQTLSSSVQRRIGLFFRRATVCIGRRGGLLTGPTPSSRRAGSGACGWKIGAAHSPTFWQRNGVSFRERAEMPLELLSEGHDSRMCEAVLTLHAIADEACAGLGMALDRPDG